MRTVCVLGEGAFGSAVALLLAHNGFHVKLWCQDSGVADCIKKKRSNDRYFPGHVFHEHIEPVTDIGQALSDVTYIFASTPVKYFRSVLKQAEPYIHDKQVWICLNKGIENETLLFPSDIIDEVCQCRVTKAVLAGPSFAKEIAEQRTTAVTLASYDAAIAGDICELLSNEFFKPYISTDIVGVQCGAALKNVIALAVGIVEGAGMTDNTKAFILTRGLHEMAQLAVSMGGSKETVYGLSGVGDVVMSSMGKLSRNLAFGRQIGKGKSLSSLQKEKSVLPEGVNTTMSMYQMMQKEKLDLPICLGVYQIIYEQKSIHDVVRELIKRPLEREC